MSLIPYTDRMNFSGCFPEKNDFRKNHLWPLICPYTCYVHQSLSIFIRFINLFIILHFIACVEVVMFCVLAVLVFGFWSKDCELLCFVMSVLVCVWIRTLCLCVCCVWCCCGCGVLNLHLYIQVYEVDGIGVLLLWVRMISGSWPQFPAHGAAEWQIMWGFGWFDHISHMYGVIWAPVLMHLAQGQAWVSSSPAVWELGSCSHWGGYCPGSGKECALVDCLWVCICTWRW